MKKIFSYLIFFILIFSSTSFACNFKIKNYGSNLEELKLEPPPLPFPNPFGGTKLLIPIEDICKDRKDLYGTLVIYLYIDNKLSQIRLERPNMNDAKLLDFAMEKYGKFNLPANVNKIQFRGEHQWDKKDEVIMYIQTNIHQGKTEIIEVTPNTYKEVMFKYNEKIGEWLDSRK